MAMDEILDAPNDTATALNYDILLHLLNLLNLNARNPSGRTALAGYARLSRAFFNPALRLLWSTLDTLTPLWLLLAPATLTRKQRASDDLLKTIIDAQLWNDPDRWDRFLYYAQLVRKVSFHPDLDRPSDLHVRLVRTVVEHNGGQTVLPSLRVFVWSLPTKRDGDMVRLLSPNVVQLVWNPNPIGPGGATAVINILRSVRNAAPLLEAYISTSFWFQVPLHWIVDELAQFQNLRIIRIAAAISYRNIHAVLSRLPLTELEATVILENESPISLPVCTGTLRVLKIRGAPSDLAKILPTWSLPSLKSATISLDDEGSDSTDAYQPEFAAVIVSPLPQAVLRMLCDSFYSGSSSPHRAAALPLAHFLRPSFQFHNLVSFTLRSLRWHAKLSADDEAFAELAAAWPSLRTLELDFTISWHAEGPLPTPLVLLTLARSCADLQELVLPYLDPTVDLEKLPPRDALPRVHSLRWLSIADDNQRKDLDVTQNAVDALAGFVGGMFPHLSPPFRRSNRRKPGNLKLWSEVFDCLRAGHTTR